MWIKMRATAAGPNWSCESGKTIELPDAVARHLVKEGYAEEIEPPLPFPPADRPAETAAVNEGERAIEPEPEGKPEPPVIEQLTGRQPKAKAGK